MSAKKTSARRVGEAIAANLGEFCDGFVAVGYVAGQPNDPLIVSKTLDHKTRQALIFLLAQAINTLQTESPEIAQ